MDQAWHVHGAQTLIRTRAFDWLELLLLFSLVDKINWEKGKEEKEPRRRYCSRMYGY